MATLDKSFDRVGGSGARRSLLRTESATRRAFLTDAAFVRRNEVTCNRNRGDDCRIRKGRTVVRMSGGNSNVSMQEEVCNRQRSCSTHHKKPPPTHTRVLDHTHEPMLFVHIHVVSTTTTRCNTLSDQFSTGYARWTVLVDTDLLRVRATYAGRSAGWHQTRRCRWTTWPDRSTPLQKTPRNGIEHVVQRVAEAG